MAGSNLVEELDTVRDNLKQALTYGDQLAKERSDWTLRSAEIDNLIQIAEEEKKDLLVSLDHLRPILDDLKEREKDLLVRLEQLQVVSDVLETEVVSFGQEMLERTTNWPDPLSNTVETDLKEVSGLLEKSEKDKSREDLASLLEVEADVLLSGISFQGNLYCSTTLRTLPDGRQAIFDVIYLGVAEGFYFSDTLGMAGRIRFQNGEWKWVEDNSLLEPLRTFLAIKDEDVRATWVGLPIGFERVEGDEG